MQAQSRGFVLSTPGFTRNKLLIFSPESEVPRFLSSVLNFTRVGPAPPAGAPPPGMPAPAPRSFAIASSALIPFFIASCHLARDADIDLEEQRKAGHKSHLLPSSCRARRSLGFSTPSSTPACSSCRSRLRTTSWPLSIGLDATSRHRSTARLTLSPLRLKTSTEW